MANTFLVKRTTVAGRVPMTSQIAAGELAVNVADGKLFLKRVAGAESIVELGQTGPEGPEGPAGPIGPASPTGATGAMGAKGDTGATGAMGATGPTPAHQWSGTSLRFNNGATWGAYVNLKGATGATGPVGATGPEGPAGADGSPDTAAQVLAKLVTVDGAGSGLNADLLDGTQASAFARLSGASFTGAVSAPGFVSSSDARLKSEITPISGALGKLKTLNGVTFRMEGVAARQMGLIAQEVRDVAPEAVTEIDGVLRLAYGNLAGLLIEAIKELAAEVEHLKRDRAAGGSHGL